MDRDVRKLCDMCAQRRLKSACAFAQSDLHRLHKETLHPWLSKMRTVMILIRLHKSAGCSESLLGGGAGGGGHMP